MKNDIQVLWVERQIHEPEPIVEALNKAKCALTKTSSDSELFEQLNKESSTIVLIPYHSSEYDLIELVNSIRRAQHGNTVSIILLAEDGEQLATLLRTQNLEVDDIIRLPIHPEVLQFKLEKLTNAQRNKAEIQLVREQIDKQASRQAIEMRVSDEEKLRRQNVALTRLSKSRAIIEGELIAALKEITRTTTETLQADRTTIWIYNEDCSSVHCVALYEPTGEQDCSNITLTNHSFANYLRALDEERVVAVADAGADERGKDFQQAQSPEPKITAYLAATFQVHGERTGVIRVDQTRATRHWNLEEQSFISSIGDLIALSMEASERKRTEETLRQSEEKLRLVLDHAHEYAFLLLDPNGAYTECSRGAELMLGYKEWELINQPSALIFTEEDRNAGVPEKEIQIARDTGQTADERWHRRKDGSKFWASGFTFALRDHQGQLRGFAKILRDITDRKLHEERSQHLNQELERRVEERTTALQEANDQMEAFCYTVAHDLRAPLRSMQSFSEILLTDLAPRLDQEAKTYLERIKTSATRMDMLIRDLLDYSRLGRIEIITEEVDLAVAVHDVLADIDAEIRSKGAEIFIQHPLPSVFGHKPTIEHVLSNLLTNALKFMRPDVKPCVRIYTERHGDWVRVWVEDNGIGIAMEHQERIFRIFERLHPGRNYPGTGVGLAIVSKAIERLGGRKGLESEVGKGSKFWFELKEA